MGFFFARALQPVLASQQFDFVLIDCPPFLGAVTLNALVATNLLIIPTQAEFFSIYALRNIMGLVKRVRTQYNPGLTYRLLLTMLDRRNRTHRGEHHHREAAALRLLKPGERLDVPELLERCFAAGVKVAGYLSDDYWLDIGRIDDYERAVRDFDAMKARLLGEAG